MDVLGSYVVGPAADPWRHHITDVVADELDRWGVSLPGWCDVVAADPERPQSLLELQTFSTWSERLTDGINGLGEASVAAHAQLTHSIAIMDDRDARRVSRQYDLDTHGSMWMLCQSINLGNIDRTSASSFADAVMAAGARLPFPRHGFCSWATAHGLISPLPPDHGPRDYL